MKGMTVFGSLGINVLQAQIEDRCITTVLALDPCRAAQHTDYPFVIAAMGREPLTPVMLLCHVS